MTLRELMSVCGDRPLEVIAVTGERFGVSIKSSDVKDCAGDSVICSAVGFGVTLDEAVLDLCRRLSNKLLILDAWTDQRREIPLPTVTP